MSAKRVPIVFHSELPLCLRCGHWLTAAHDMQLCWPCYEMERWTPDTVPDSKLLNPEDLLDERTP